LKKLCNESVVFTQKLSSELKIFTLDGKIANYSNLTAQTRAVEYFQLTYTFNGLNLTQNHKTELENSSLLLRYL
jgi:hypothetical protein